MSAIDTLDDRLIDGLAPADAPTDQDLTDARADDNGEPANDAAERVARFEIDDVGSADWAGRKIRQAQARINQAQAWRDRVVAEADHHLEREKSRHQPTVDFFEMHLTAWLRREIEYDPKGAKSRDLPCGIRVKRTVGRPRLVVDDHDALVDWVTSQADPAIAGLAKPEWKVDKAAVKQLVVKDGLALKGAHVETGEDTYKVETGGAS